MEASVAPGIVCESTRELEIGGASGCGSGRGVDDELESVPEGTALMSEISSFGRDKASATTLALPLRYRISVVYSEIQASWYVCRIVWGSVFFVIDGTRLAWSV